MRYEPVIGLEVHAELSTKSKIFCACSTEFGGEINTHVCPVCCGMPGSLPVLNRKVVEYAVKMGLALHCKINRHSAMARKNYFYPDLPKAYQITQFEIPVCGTGYVEYMLEGEKKTCRMTRIHIEEDAGKLLHDALPGTSVIDYNRCGVPLIEMVSEPDLRSSAEARAFLEQIKTILSYLDICDCKMQEGSIRCDINVSLREPGSDGYGTRVEMKNVNTFSGAARAIDYEIGRQEKILDSGGRIEQETRRWDDIKQQNYPMRSKEDAQDYRYFPEPDLITVEVTDEWVEEIRKSLPELPMERYERFKNTFGFGNDEARQLTANSVRADFLDECVLLGADPCAAAKWLQGDIAKLINERGVELDSSALTPDALKKLLDMIETGSVSGSVAKTVLEILFDEGGEPESIVNEKGLGQISDENEVRKIVRTVLEENRKTVEDFKSGKQTAAGYLVGQCMKASKGKANPQIVNKLLREMLEQM